MASFVARYQKKHLRLAIREWELRTLVSKGAGEEDVRLAAEAVRAARIRALKEELGKVKPDDEEAYARIGRKIEAVRELAVDVIIAESTKTKGT